MSQQEKKTIHLTKIFFFFFFPLLDKQFEEEKEHTRLKPDIISLGLEIFSQSQPCPAHAPVTFLFSSWSLTLFSRSGSPVASTEEYRGVGLGPEFAQRGKKN